MHIKNIELNWLGHACFMIKTKKGKIIYIDPYSIEKNNEELDKGDFILITHSHPDHCSITDINKVIKKNSKVVLSADSQSKINRVKIPIRLEIAKIGEELDFQDIRILPFPAYNIDKSFHPKDEGWLGYIIKMDDTIIYHAGDTDIIPEMKKLTGYKKNGREFIVLLPVGGRFTMDAEEAFEATQIIKPNLAIPMHYGNDNRNIQEGEEFVKFCREKNINAKILDILK